ncbi:uncharacterized protein LOC108678975 [Hyalella azteca]|uniref:Uncharacterized protein LOC108678975 n=1 Tax=Hyalella azteca TaxID=294128 RepID=A0A8B7PCK5_HYAAZ|nr:uncharacterized protein LOC108678975 [Hyalella azteca]
MVFRLLRSLGQEQLDAHQLELMLVSIVLIAILPTISTPALLLSAHRNISIEDLHYGSGMKIAVACLTQNPTYQSASLTGVTIPANDSGLTNSSHFRPTCPYHLDVGSSIQSMSRTPSPRQYRQDSRKFGHKPPIISGGSPVIFAHTKNEQRHSSWHTSGHGFEERHSLSVSPPGSFILSHKATNNGSHSCSKRELDDRITRSSLSSSPRYHDAKRLSLSHSYTASLSPMPVSRSVARRKRSYDPPRSPIHLTLSALGRDTLVSHSYNNLQSSSHFSHDIASGPVELNYSNLDSSLTPTAFSYHPPDTRVSPLLYSQCHSRRYEGNLDNAYLTSASQSRI